MAQSKPYILLMCVVSLDSKHNSFTAGDLLLNEDGIYYLPMTDIASEKFPRLLYSPGLLANLLFPDGDGLRIGWNLAQVEAWRDAVSTASLELSLIRDRFWGLSFENRSVRLSRPSLFFPRDSVDLVTLETKGFSLTFNCNNQTHNFGLVKGNLTSLTARVMREYFDGKIDSLYNEQYLSDPLGIYINYPSPIRIVEVLAEGGTFDSLDSLEEAANDNIYVKKLCSFLENLDDEKLRDNASEQFHRLPIHLLRAMKKIMTRSVRSTVPSVIIFSLWCAGLITAGIITNKYISFWRFDVFFFLCVALIAVVTGIWGYCIVKAFIANCYYLTCVRRAIRRLN